MPSPKSTLLEVINVDSLGYIFSHIFFLCSYTDILQFFRMMDIQVVFNLGITVNNPCANIVEHMVLSIDFLICRIVS